MSDWEDLGLTLFVAVLMVAAFAIAAHTDLSRRAAREACEVANPGYECSEAFVRGKPHLSSKGNKE